MYAPKTLLLVHICRRLRLCIDSEHLFLGTPTPTPPPPSPFFQLCCLIAEKGKGIVLWKGPVNNLLKDNYRGYDDLFVSLTFFFFRYPIIM